jgi:predicted GNAT family acetyltransferase
VSGPVETVRLLAKLWADKAGRPMRVTSRQRLHRLDRVTPAPPTSGAWRLARADDRELLIEWAYAFADDVGMSLAHSPAPGVDATIAAGHAFLWEDEGERVSHVGTHAPVAGVPRVGPVYTPPARRGRGYATALTAVVSQRWLDDGATACSLYTDLANPTSNKIYAAIGYKPVLDVEVHTYA